MSDMNAPCHPPLYQHVQKVHPFSVTTRAAAATNHPLPSSGPTMAPITTFDSRTSLFCDRCSTTVDNAPLIHLLHNCSHLFHLDCLIDGVFARLRCPVCSVKIERAELASDHCSQFVRMPLADIFEEGVMRANRRRLRAASALGARSMANHSSLRIAWL